MLTENGEKMPTDKLVDVSPLSTLGALSDDAHRSVARDVRAALQAYLHNGDFAVPMEAHVALALR